MLAAKHWRGCTRRTVRPTPGLKVRLHQLTQITRGWHLEFAFRGARRRASEGNLKAYANDALKHLLRALEVCVMAYSCSPYGESLLQL